VKIKKNMRKATPNKTKYAIGIDLHGTLLDTEWKIKDCIKGELVTALERVRKLCRIYVCSGNDLTFIKKYIPEEVQKCMDGYVLETGCVISDGISEEIIASKNLVKEIKELERKLQDKNFKEVKYFARRLATISLFTRTEQEGLDPVEFYPLVRETIKELGYANKVYATHSNVAVDVVPNGYNKFFGINYVSKGLSVIGIADSLNDIHLVSDADCAFIPANASPSLIQGLRTKNKKIIDLNVGEVMQINKNIVLQSQYNETEAVVEILEFIEKKLR